MAPTKRDDSLPIAVSTQGGLVAAMAVLFAGTLQGTRAWIVIIKAATAFLLTSAFLKLFTAGVMQAIRWKATVPDERRREEDEDGDSAAIEDTVETIRSQAPTHEPRENPAS